MKRDVKTPQSQPSSTSPKFIQRGSSNPRMPSQETSKNNSNRHIASPTIQDINGTLNEAIKKQGSQVHPLKNIRIEVPNAIHEIEFDSQGHTEHVDIAISSNFKSSQMDQDAEGRSALVNPCDTENSPTKISPLLKNYCESAADNSSHKISSRFLDSFIT